MSLPEDDFEQFWTDLQGDKAPSILEIASKPKDYTYGLEEASVKAEFELKQEIAKLDLASITTEVVSRMVSRGIRTFVRHWLGMYRNQDIAGLVEFIIDNLNLPPHELKGLMTALPRSLVERVTKNVYGSSRGIHALFALEWHYREGNLPSGYSLVEVEGRTVVRVRKDGNDITFTLDEDFPT